MLGSSPPPKSPVSPSSALPPQSEKTMAAGGPLPPPSPSGEQKSLGSPTSLEKGLHLTGPLPPPSASIVPRSPDSPTSLEKGLHLTGPLQPSTSIVEGQVGYWVELVQYYSCSTFIGLLASSDLTSNFMKNA